jgi:hypothetical protein
MNTPALTLLLAAASVAQAQTAPVAPAVKPGEVGRLGLAFADSGETDGYRLGVDARLVRDFYLHGSFADISGPASLNDARAYSLGLSYRQDFGPGKASLGAAIGALDGDVLDGDQHQLRVAYALRPTKELEVEFSLTHYLNSLDDVTGVDTDDLTAPALTLRYTFAQGVGLEASFSSENTLLGIDTDDGAWSLGVTFSF